MVRLTNKNIAKMLEKNFESTITTSQNVSRDIYLKCSYLEDFLEEHDCETLADYTKQVRKEVCEEVYNKCEPLFRLVNNYDNGDVIERNELVDILDQIQGE